MHEGRLHQISGEPDPHGAPWHPAYQRAPMLDDTVQVKPDYHFECHQFDPRYATEAASKVAGLEVNADGEPRFTNPEQLRSFQAAYNDIDPHATIEFGGAERREMSEHRAR